MNNTRLSEQSSAGITIFGADWCGDCTRAKQFFDERGTAYEWIDLEAHPEAAAQARSISGRNNIPVIVYADGSHQVEPSNHDLAAKFSEQGLP